MAGQTNRTEYRFYTLLMYLKNPLRKWMKRLASGWKGKRGVRVFSAQTNRCSLIYSFIFTHHGWQMHALLLIRIQIRTCALATRLQLRSDGVERYKWQPLHPRCHPLSKLELELGLVLGNASAKQRQVKNVFSFFCVFVF